MTLSDAVLSFAAPGGALTERRTADRILACNDVTGAYGLTLTERQALALAQTRTDALRETRRIEWGDGIVGTLIETFCTSPYILPDNYEETLHDLIALFYSLKNETQDRVSDNDLLAFLKTAFDGFCRGSLDRLSGAALRLSAHIRRGKPLETFREE